MKYVIDTSSLLQFVRYYRPFDNQQVLFNFIKNEVEQGELIVLDKIWEECQYTSRGIVTHSLEFIGSNVVNTKSLLPNAPQRLSNMLDNNFCIPLIKQQLGEKEYLAAKSLYYDTGDYKILVYVFPKSSLFDEYTVITEETRFANDKKCFKKIPEIMSQIGVPVQNIAEYLKSKGIDADWFVNVS